MSDRTNLAVSIAAENSILGKISKSTFHHVPDAVESSAYLNELTRLKKKDVHSNVSFVIENILLMLICSIIKYKDVRKDI